MVGDWQEIAALALIFAAMAYLVRPFVRRPARRPIGGCALSMCRGCPLGPDARPGRACDDPAGMADLSPSGPVANDVVRPRGRAEASTSPDPPFVNLDPP